jgi:hypothetical protein
MGLTPALRNFLRQELALAIAAAARSGCARCASAPRRATRTGSGATAGRCRPSRRVGRSTRTSLGCQPDGYNLRASYVQVNPRKTKQNQGKMLGFPWIPLAESGLFKGLQRIQIKKSSPASTLVTGCALNPLGETHSLPFTQASTARGSTRMFVTQISDFAKPIRNACRSRMKLSGFGSTCFVRFFWFCFPVGLGATRQRCPHFHRRTAERS